MSHLTERFVIGRIGKPRGLKGEVRVFPLTDQVERFENLTSCYLEDEAGNVLMKLDLANVRIVQNQVSLVFKQMFNREAADKITGLYLSVDRSDAIDLPDDSFFIPDLIGCDVYDQSYGYLGMISDIQQYSNADVVTVKDKGKKDLLYPNLKSIVQNIDLERKRVDVNLPNGLYEIYR